MVSAAFACAELAHHLSTCASSLSDLHNLSFFILVPLPLLAQVRLWLALPHQQCKRAHMSLITRKQYVFDPSEKKVLHILNSCAMHKDAAQTAWKEYKAASPQKQESIRERFRCRVGLREVIGLAANTSAFWHESIQSGKGHMPPLLLTKMLLDGSLSPSARKRELHTHCIGPLLSMALPAVEEEHTNISLHAAWLFAKATFSLCHNIHPLSPDHAHSLRRLASFLQRRAAAAKNPSASVVVIVKPVDELIETAEEASSSSSSISFESMVALRQGDKGAILKDVLRLVLEVRGHTSESRERLF